MTSARGRFILALAVLAVPLGSAGQVRIVQDGRALDANPYVGSGGYNPISPTGEPTDSQLLVNRQVTGLAGFRGAVGYYPVDQLNLALPTDTMDTFRGQSVGVQDVLRGQTYSSTPYYDPARTVVGLRSIAAGQVVPGGAVLRTLPPPGLLGQGGTVAYTPMVISPLTGATGMPLRTMEGLAPRGDSADRLGTDRRNLFAVSDASQRERLARELSGVELPNELMVRSEVQSAVDPSAAAQWRDRTGRPVGIGEPNEPNAAAGVEPLAGTQYRRPEALMLPPDQDVFSDVLGRMYAASGGSGSAPTALPQPSDRVAQDAGPASATDDIQARQAQLRSHPAAVGEEGLSFTGGRGTLVEYVPRKGLLVLHSLAGTGRDEFNVVMTRAGKALKEGKYNEAAQGYRDATALQPTNPLAKMGLSLSLFATGESLGAARYLRAAAEVFPPILTSQLDLGSMVDTDLIRRRLEFLAGRLETYRVGPEPMLYFIAAYLHANLGQADQAKDYALKLKASAAEDTILGNYARFLLGEEPTSAPASQPVSQPIPASP